MRAVSFHESDSGHANSSESQHQFATSPGQLAFTLAQPRVGPSAPAIESDGTSPKVATLSQVDVCEEAALQGLLDKPTKKTTAIKKKPAAATETNDDDDENEGESADPVNGDSDEHEEACEAGSSDDESPSAAPIPKSILRMAPAKRPAAAESLVLAKPAAAAPITVNKKGAKPALAAMQPMRRPAAAPSDLTRVDCKVPVLTKKDVRTTTLKNICSSIYHASRAAARRHGFDAETAKEYGRECYRKIKVQWDILCPPPPKKAGEGGKKK